MQMRSKILNLPRNSSTAVHRSVLKNDKIKGASMKETKPSTRLTRGKVVIGCRDENSKL